MRHLFLIALAVGLLAGCASTPFEEVPTDKTESVLVLNPNLKGRGCAWTSVKRATDGSYEIEMIVAQDGTSSWSVSNMLSWLGEVAGSIFGGSRNLDAPPGPDPLHGCEQLFEPTPPPAASPDRLVL